MPGATIKIFKKCSPNGRLYVFLGKREFISCDGKVEEVRGVANMPEHEMFLNGKFVYASLVCTFRHGREEDEVMGVSFAKELVVDRAQIYPRNECDEMNKLQERLVQKLGDSARPFTLAFPKTAPNSVLIKGDDGDAANMGVNYEVRLHVADSGEDYKGQKKSTVGMGIRKGQWAPADLKERSPTATADKGFMYSKGKLVLEVNLDKEIHYHGQEIPVQVKVNNSSKKSVKSIRVGIVQHCELTMIQAQYNCKVATLETKDGCPLGPGANLSRTFTLKPLSQMVTHERGLALDASLSRTKDESNLASSSIAETGDANDLLGVIVSYSIKVKVLLSGMGGELEVDLPFKLVHPRPESEEMSKLEELKKATAEAAEKSNKRRQKFQAQESVLVDTMAGSLDNE